jgi:imidazole glycerol phosphate synthase subunit HisF
LAYCGGIREFSQINDIFATGFDKIFLSASNPKLACLANYTNAKYGAQALGLSLDYCKSSRLRLLYNPYTRASSENTLLLSLQQIPIYLFSDLMLTCVTTTGSSSGVDLDVLEELSRVVISNPLILSGGLYQYNREYFNSLTSKYKCLSGISASTSIFLQTRSFGSALVCLKRHEF